MKKQWNKLDKKLILASASPRRSEILSKMGISFDVILGGEIDEAQFFLNVDSPKLSVERLAIAKGEELSQLYPDRPILSADTIVYHRDVLGKPASRDEAFQTLRSLSGVTHEVITSVALQMAEGSFLETRTITTEVTFRDIEDWEIDSYLSLSTYADKAGSYGIQDEAFAFVKSISGCYYTVVGLPVAATIELLESFLNHTLVR